MARNDSFLGTGWRFPPSFGQTDRRATVVSGEEDIRESLRILLSTRPGERIMQPDYGCDLHALVFSELDANAVTAMQDAIRRAVLFFEPRIILNSIDVDDTRTLEGILALQLNYTIRTTNTRSNMVFPFYFLEGTELVAG
jgi:uncharacterized protein